MKTKTIPGIYKLDIMYGVLNQHKSGIAFQYSKYKTKEDFLEYLWKILITQNSGGVRKYTKHLPEELNKEEIEKYLHLLNIQLFVCVEN